MNKTSNNLMVPFLKELNYQTHIPSNSIIYGRFLNDFQKDCLLFKHSKSNAMSQQEVNQLRGFGFKMCYVYDQLDLENREFTEEGFLSIRNDIRHIIKAGFTHILLSNAYLIELVSNEFSREIHIVISQQLECNSSRAKVFFDVLNDTSPISHLIVSQNHLTENDLLEMKSEFKNIELVVEADRWASDIQIIHEHYYNIIYGHYNNYAIEELSKFVKRTDILSKIKSPNDFYLDVPHITTKLGEINVKPKLFLNNLKKFLKKDYDKIRIIDFNLWYD